MIQAAFFTRSTIFATIGTLGERFNRRSEDLDSASNMAQSIGLALLVLSSIPDSAYTVHPIVATAKAVIVTVAIISLSIYAQININGSKLAKNYLSHVVLTAVKIINLAAIATLMVNHLISQSFFNLMTPIIVSAVALQVCNTLHTICDRILDAQRTTRNQTFDQYRLSHLNELSISTKLAACWQLYFPKTNS
ncbi:MAG: hypothetical protein ACHQUC_01770 [Chlamydiales bacterium]